MRETPPPHKSNQNQRSPVVCFSSKKRPAVTCGVSIYVLKNQQLPVVFVFKVKKTAVTCGVLSSATMMAPNPGMTGTRGARATLKVPRIDRFVTRGTRRE